MKAADVMTSPVFVVGPAENVARARNLMLKHRISRLPVIDNGKLVGIITKKDIGYRLRQTEPVWRRRPIDHIPVSVLMTPDPATVAPSAGIREISSLMVGNDISGVPVVENGEVAGIVTKSDLMRSALIGKLTTRVEDVMEDVITISRYHSLTHIIDLMRERNDTVVVINNDGTLAGIITQSNLAFFLYVNEKMELPVKDITMLRKEVHGGRKSFRYVVETAAIAEDFMSRPVITITPDARLSEAVDLMREKHINSLVVMQDDDIRGIIKRDDIIREVAK
ncbi:MAG: CBS domain-containing protein [Methanomicrobiales archaeon]|nr:CBS domain-containing protein [Methanomicrobiales archaeon]NYT20414.1 CBS domain-containing protein [Methanomicrobiales archaeon]